MVQGQRADDVERQPEPQRRPGQECRGRHQPHRERQPDPFGFGLAQPRQVGEQNRQQRSEDQQVQPGAAFHRREVERAGQCGDAAQHECAGVVAPGEPLLEIGDTRSLEVATDVLSADAVQIKPGMKVLYERWGGALPLEGQVLRVEPVGFTKVSALGVEEQRVLVISGFTSDPQLWQTLGDGYRVESRFVLWQQEDVLQIPLTALFRSGDQWALFVVEDNQAKRRVVKVGQRNGLSAQILDGLKEGETVITHPDDAIEEGVRVKSR